jgi:hypothetical protein
MKVIGSIVIVVLVLVAGFVIGKEVSLGTFDDILKKPETAVTLLVAFVALAGSISGPVVTYLLGVKQAETASAQAAAAMKSAQAAMRSAEAAMTTATGTGRRAFVEARLEWLKQLQENLSEYHAILMSSGDPVTSDAERAKFEADERRLAHLGTNLDLLLDQTEPDQKALWNISDEILTIEGKHNRWDRD